MHRDNLLSFFYFMANTILIGAQWGDEGKGKIIDVLTARADIVVRPLLPIAPPLLVALPFLLVGHQLPD